MCSLKIFPKFLEISLRNFKEGVPSEFFEFNSNWSIKKQDLEEVNTNHCMKIVRIMSFSGLYSPAFEQNMERYFVSLHYVFSSNARKYGLEKLQIRTLFTQWELLGLNHLVLLEKIYSNGLYVSMRSWKLNVMIKDRGTDYLVLNISSFFEKTQ